MSYQFPANPNYLNYLKKDSPQIRKGLIKKFETNFCKKEQFLELAAGIKMLKPEKLSL